MWSFSVWQLPGTLTILAALAVLAVLRTRAPAPGLGALRWGVFAVLWWAGTHVAGIGFTELDAQVWAQRLQYPAIALVPMCWMAFALGFVRRRSTPVPVLLGLLVLPLVTSALALTSDLHGLLWRNVFLVDRGPFIGLAVDYGPWFAVHAAWSYGLILVATVLLVVRLAESPRHRRELVAVIAAPAVCLLANLSHLSGWTPVPWLDLTPLSFTLALGILAWATLHDKLLALAPLGLKAVVQELVDPVVVVDDRGRIADLNDAAASTFEVARHVALDANLERFIQDAEVLRLVTYGGAERETVLTCDGEERTYMAGVSSVTAGEGQVLGTALVLRDITQRREAEEQLESASRELERLANTDALTGLSNRRAFTAYLTREVQRARRYNRPLALLILDLDHFKKVNDTWGHDTGDQVLVSVSAALERMRRRTDLAARLGGEEFAMILPETDAEGANTIAERLRRHVQGSLVTNPQGEPFHVTTSVGVTTLGGSGDTAQTLINRADTALYRSKSGGRNRVTLLEPVVDEAAEQRAPA